MNYRETSREAWERFREVSGELDRAILGVLRAGPATCQEIERRTDRSHQAVSGNLRHLVERGLVVASGEHGKTESGRRAIKWRLVERGEDGSWMEARDRAMAERAERERREKQADLFGGE